MIEIDGVNIRNIGLDVLRRRLALVPQDSTLFKGTLRDNLYVSLYAEGILVLKSFFRDPQATRTDAELISALQRAWLLPRDGSHDPIADVKFSLTSLVADEGRYCNIDQMHRRDCPTII